jgi:hypothetical protein
LNDSIQAFYRSARSTVSFQAKKAANQSFHPGQRPAFVVEVAAIEPIQ